MRPDSYGTYSYKLEGNTLMLTETRSPSGREGYELFIRLTRLE